MIREGVKSCFLGRILEHCSPPLLSLVHSTPPTPFDARPGGSGLDSAVINGGGAVSVYICLVINVGCLLKKRGIC